jgi:hypothetical protein
MATGSMTIGDFSAKDRQVYFKSKKGDVVGTGYTIPKGDFARFLGMKEPTAEEKQGKVSGWRAIEVAMHREFNKLGEQSVKDGAHILAPVQAHGKLENEPGRVQDQLQDGLHAMKESMEIGASANMRYLEMQYKFQMASMSYGTISNLMKARYESVKKSISEIR